MPAIQMVSLLNNTIVVVQLKVQKESISHHHNAVERKNCINSVTEREIPCGPVNLKRHMLELIGRSRAHAHVHTLTQYAAEIKGGSRI